MNREVHIRESLYVGRWKGGEEGGGGRRATGRGWGVRGSDNNHRENLSTVQGN